MAGRCVPRRGGEDAAQVVGHHRGKELGEFASRYAAMLFAERLNLKDGFSIVRRPLQSAPLKVRRRRVTFRPSAAWSPNFAGSDP